ncbi:phosphoenolpyruvate--protein phosphotransferase [Halomonas litopenaei]|uniref:phosphoenolpyruvate--protein phosphotransferase n=1 Tax=Halomonas litopenaei TaxID=2109328 RepID=A0ABX5J0L5_9GAMM|nr:MULTISPECIES: phosphoenolpyruvate--protein phosphotransferase [Halomonas]PTL91824.1 phosphoenolpyruvate--protein phosphotransferase [Halomonas sp. SYSU XM8]PTL94861.1 phosphoenolpyruvate--protein phosphotransferase [Halomonas litopenaei]
MLTLNADDILLDCRAESWRHALDAAFDTLKAASLVDDGYRQGLVDRESQSSTWLGNGIAIPHGTPESRGAVRRTGVRVLQFPEGVRWHDGNLVHVLVTIAAQSDEHLDILRSLTHVLDRDGVSERLAQASSAEEITELLARPVVRPRLDQDTLVLGHRADDLLDLALAGAQRLRQLALVDTAYLAEMVTSMPTHLGRGLWLASSEAGVSTPALAAVTPAKPVQHQGSDVEAVLCLASHGEAGRPLADAIVSLVASLDESDAAHLRERDADDWLALLAGEGGSAQSRRVRLLNAHGLHARPAKVLVQKARESGVAVQVRLAEGSGRPVSAASLTKVIGLGARRGQELILSARGEGAEQALTSLVEAINDGLGEQVTPLASSAVSQAGAEQAVAEPVAASMPSADQPLEAVAASPGLAVAPLFVIKTPDFDYPREAADPALERQRLERAIAQGGEQLKALIARTAGGEVAAILSMHEEMLEDPELAQAAREGIDEGLSAEAAWWQAIDVAARAQEQLADRLLAERAADLRDVGRRVLGILCDVELPEPPAVPYLLVTDDIGPSDVARLDTERVRGILTARGGATAHSAILARALGIPAVVGAGAGVLALENGTEMLLDGDEGWVVPAPSQARRERFEARMEALEALKARAWDARFEDARTEDGTRVEVVANLGNTAHARDAVSRGAEGVGLLRTEFLFMAHASLPDVETQEREYREALDALDGRPLVARTLDVGGDKPLAYWPLPQEDNPFLGLRGIRLALRRPQVLRDQFSALVKAADGRPLRIMLPMVKDLDEFRAARAIFDEVLRELGVSRDGDRLQLGVMIEVPSCALLAPSLAPEVDFFSIGTNDLTQYTLAIDRGHPELSGESDGLHPAVLRLIQMTVQAAHAHGKWVGVCGELASDRQAIPVLVGLGIDELSVSARQVPMVKARLASVSTTRARELAALALAAPTARDVRRELEASQ